MAEELAVDAVFAIDVTPKFLKRAWEKKQVFGRGAKLHRKVRFVQGDLLNFFWPEFFVGHRIKRVVMVFATPPCTWVSDANTQHKEGSRACRRKTRASEEYVEVAVDLHRLLSSPLFVGVDGGRGPPMFLENPAGNKPKALIKRRANPGVRHLEPFREALPVVKPRVGFIDVRPVLDAAAGPHDSKAP